MGSIAFEIAVIVVLLLANGLFAMTEIAIVSARKTRLKQLADLGDARAKAAIDLAEAPNRFLATVQIGITLVGIFAGAFGGATLTEKLAAWMIGLGAPATYANPASFVLVVATLTYFSLLIGELVPKRIGLSNPEGIAMSMASFMQRLSVFAGPVVSFLSRSTELLLKLTGIRSKREETVSEDEVRGLMQEGLRAGAFNRVESQIVHGALELDQLHVHDLMTPRPKIIWINKEDTHDVVWHKIVISGHTHYPVHDGNRDNAVGIVSLKAIYANLAAGATTRIADLMVKPLVVPANQSAIHLLEQFKQSGKHIALVSDEFGGIVGLVTLNDIMEAVLGEFPSQEERARPAIKRRDDGSLLIDAMIAIEQVEAALPGFNPSEAGPRDYQTLAGFIMKKCGRIPKEGETIQSQGYTLEVLDMDHHRVDKVLVLPPGFRPGTLLPPPSNG